MVDTIDSSNQPGWGASEPNSPANNNNGTGSNIKEPIVPPTTSSGGTYTDAQGRSITAEQAAAQGTTDQPGVSQFERIQGLGGSGAPQKIQPGTTPGQLTNTTAPAPQPGQPEFIGPVNQTSRFKYYPAQPGSPADQHYQQGLKEIKTKAGLINPDLDFYKLDNPKEQEIFYVQHASRVIDKYAFDPTKNQSFKEYGIFGGETIKAEPGKLYTRDIFGITRVSDADKIHARQISKSEAEITKNLETGALILSPPGVFTSTAAIRGAKVVTGLKDLTIIKTPSGKEPWIVELPNKLGTVKAPQAEGLIPKPSNVPAPEALGLYTSTEKPGSLFVKVPRSEIEAAGTGPTVSGASGDTLAVKISQKLGLPYTIGSKGPALESVRLAPVQPVPDAPRLNAINYDMDITPTKPSGRGMDYKVWTDKVKAAPTRETLTGVPARQRLKSPAVSELEMQLNLMRLGDARVNVIKTEATTTSTAARSTNPTPALIDLSESIRTALEPKYAVAFNAATDYSNMHPGSISQVVPPNSPVTVRTPTNKRISLEVAQDIAKQMSAGGNPAIAKGLQVKELETMDTLVNVEYFNQVKDESGSRFDKNFGSEYLTGMNILSVDLKKTQQPADTSILAKYFGTNPADVPFFDYGPGLDMQPGERIKHKLQPKTPLKPQPTTGFKSHPSPQANPYSGLSITPNLDTITTPRYDFKPPAGTGMNFKFKTPELFGDEKKKSKAKKKVENNYFRTFRQSPIAAASTDLSGLRKAMGLTTTKKRRRKHK